MSMVVVNISYQHTATAFYVIVSVQSSFPSTSTPPPSSSTHERIDSLLGEWFGDYLCSFELPPPPSSIALLPYTHTTTTTTPPLASSFIALALALLLMLLPRSSVRVQRINKIRVNEISPENRTNNKTTRSALTHQRPLPPS